MKLLMSEQGRSGFQMTMIHNPKQLKILNKLSSILELTILSKINSQAQHTPNPEAQLPSLVPPLFEHSSLKF